MPVGDDDWPLELRLTDGGRALAVSFESGASFNLPAEYLRVSSPSAEVQGHAPSERKIVAGKRDVRVAAAIPVGNYAVKLAFDDGHDTGLFTWRYLHQLGAEYSERWEAHLSELKTRGLQR